MASSSSISPSIPTLSFPLEKQTAQGGNIISRSESQQPTTHSVREYSPKKSMSTYSFSTCVSEEDKNRAIGILQQSLGEFFRAVTSPKAAQDGIVLVQRRGGRGGIGFRNLKNKKAEDRLDNYGSRGSKTLWTIVGTIQSYIELGQSTFTYKTKEGELATEHVFTLISKTLNIGTFREFANQSELLRHKIVKCFYKVMVGQLEQRCCDILELIAGVTKIPLFEGLSLLRTLAVKNYHEANPEATIENPIAFFGYDSLFLSAEPGLIACYQDSLAHNPALILSWDGKNIVETRLDFQYFKTLIGGTCDDMLRLKVRDQGSIAHQENLKMRVSLQIDAMKISSQLEEFETMFRNYIESNLQFLEKHFRSKFSTDLKSFRERLNSALVVPYNRYELINLCTLLNYVVWNVLEKHNVVQREGAQMNIVGTPRKLLSI